MPQRPLTPTGLNLGLEGIHVLVTGMCFSPKDHRCQELTVFPLGASGGIGLETAEQFLGKSRQRRHTPIQPLTKAALEQGAIVTAHYNTNFEPLSHFADSRSQVLQADLSKEDDVVQLFDKATYTFGPVQILIINHAISIVKDEYLWEMSLDRWNKTMNANLTSTFLVAREYLRRLKDVAADLKEEACIILIGSTAGKYG